MPDQVSVLFVCLGNICRSPSAEGVFRQIAEEQGLAGNLRIDSCGTGNWHTGKTPAARAASAAERRGIEVSDLTARQIQVADLDTFDNDLVMYRSNLADDLHRKHQ